MPEKSLQVATYAAGASLAAITLIYVFAPTYLLDSENAARSGSSRKRGVVGLSNPANDCFINSILQALAGLGELRLYLIRETHRRSLDDDDDAAAANNDSEDPNRHDASFSSHKPPSARSVYKIAVPHDGLPEWKILGLQGGLVTAGLKRILDQLNERPIAKKTASALPFVRELEGAFRQRISRQQQDAQEFLQVVAERLCDEYHAGRRARRAARSRGAGLAGSEEDAPLADQRLENFAVAPRDAGSGGVDSEKLGAIQPIAKDTQTEDEDEDEDSFPMEGKFESQIECLTCGFKPRPKEDTFCTLTLNVPQVSSTTLNACFDGIFKTEYIDDFKCEKCRLVHAKGVYEVELSRLPAQDTEQAAAKRRAIEQLQLAIETDPERAPEGVPLPDARYAPKRRIARHIRMTSFPKILAVHLSRSIYERSQSQKNSAKVAFPERLPLGGLLHRRKYKLLGVVAHKGSHHSGHYESFRRQNFYAPYSTPNAFAGAGIYGKSGGVSSSSVLGTPASRTPRFGPLQKGDGASSSSPAVSTPDLSLGAGTGAGTPATTPSNSSADDAVGSPITAARPSSSASRLASLSLSPRKEKDKDKDTDSSSLRSVARSTLSRMAGSSSRSGSKRRGAAAEDQQQTSDGSIKPATSFSSPLAKTSSRRKKLKSQDNMWWRLSDEKVKEATTKDVLGMQREVYLLFYEMEKDDE